MNLLLISANSETINMVPLPLGLNCVAVAARNAGHRVKLVDLMGTSTISQIISDAVQESQPRLIGISVRNVDNQSMAETRFLLEPVREIVHVCRSISAATVVIGGAGFSIFPQAVLEYLGADVGVCGEGEAAFVALVDALERGADTAEIPGLCFPGKRPQGSLPRLPLENLPLPDSLLWSCTATAADEIWIPFQTRRGCPMKCSYCSTPALEGTAVRVQPVQKVIDGLRAHVDAGFHQFYFVDNTFNFPLNYAKELCAAIASARLNIKWRAIIYPGFVDSDLARKMAEAGCVEVSLGFESGCPSILQSLNKKYDPDQVRQSARLLQEVGIRRMGFLLFGAPGETRDSVEQSLDFADSLHLEMLKVSMGIRIYPDTALAETAIREGVISANDDLLEPKFYLAKGLDEWLGPKLKEWMAQRPWCVS